MVDAASGCHLAAHGAASGDLLGAAVVPASGMGSASQLSESDDLPFGVRHRPDGHARVVLEAVILQPGRVDRHHRWRIAGRRGSRLVRHENRIQLRVGLVAQRRRFGQARRRREMQVVQGRLIQGILLMRRVRVRIYTMALDVNGAQRRARDSAVQIGLVGRRAGLQAPLLYNYLIVEVTMAHVLRLIHVLRREVL